MSTEGSKNLGKLTVSDGGRAGERRTQADLELDRAVQAFLYAMRRKDGRAVGKNIANAAGGVTKPMRMIVRRIKDARAARNHQHNYPLAKAIAKELDRYVDREFGQDITTTGEHPRAA